MIPHRCAAGILALAAALPSVSPPLAAQELSHRERFASPRARLEAQERAMETRIQQSLSDADAFNRRGMARLQMGRSVQAVSDLEMAVRLQPRNSDFHAALGFGYWSQGRLAEALGAAQKAISLEARNPSAHATAARALAAMNRPQESVAHFEQALELAPEETELRFDYLTALRGVKARDAAMLQLRLLRASLPAADARVAYAEGLMARDANDMDAAARAFRRAAALNPRFPPARQDLAAALTRLGQWEEALPVLAALRQESPQSFDIAYLGALTLHALGYLRNAETEAQRALALRADSPEAKTLLGVIQATLGEHQKAIAQLESAAKSAPADFSAQFSLGRAYYSIRDLSGARAQFERALRLKPDSLDARFFLATALEGLGQADAAEQEYRELIRRAPDDPRGHVGLGAMLAKRGDDEAAAAALRKARALGPKAYEPALALGRLLAKIGDVEQAVNLLSEAAALRPDSAEAHYQLALALRRAGRAEEAAREFATVERLNQARRGSESPQQERE